MCSGLGIGALGRLGIQYSKAAGFETIAVTYSKDKEELAYKLRADSVVANGEGLLKEGQHDSLGGGSSSGVDVLQVILTRQLQTQLKVLDQMDGRFVLIGVSTEPFTISPEILFKRARIIGSTQNDREHLYEALDYVAKGKVRVMTEIFPLEEISNAYDQVANGNVRFKAVIKPIK
jgi:alcohol dehydrogenase